MQVAVAGASGFIGQATVHALLQAGHAVVGLSRGRRGRSDRPGLVWREVDVSRGGPELVAALAGCEAVVNLVGIKRPEPGQSFDSAHVATVAALTTAMQAAAIRRLVHVSVAGPRAEPPRPTQYMATKREAERSVMSSETDWTILRPGPVAGPGDDFVRNLAATLRHAGVFPAPDGGHAPLQPVLVEDVALAIAAALERPAAIGRCYDVVGPEVLTLREVVTRVADALALPVTLVPCPAPLLAVAVAGLEKQPEPLLTRAQLGLLSHGLVGDPGPAASELGLVTQPLTAAKIVALSAGVEPWLGLSLRLRRGDEDMFFKTCSKGAVHVAWLVPLAVALIWGLGSLTPHVWWRMLAANLVLVPLCLMTVRLPWLELWRPSLRGLVQGVMAAAVLVAAGWLGSQVLFAVTPEARAEVAAVYSWVHLLPAGIAAVLLPLIAAAEEVVWRGAVAFAVASRAGPWWGAATSAAAFAVAHVSLGVPALVVAAAGAGFFWAWLGLKTRSLFVVLVCHVLWDACVAVLRLY
ncbi:NAD(P)H-binding protein [Nannocystis sp. RBIL2]|uniref:NAD(P)H-binding protein n=1 Tax=Nannocystis sp. RBIL2 TaxID=2996788 RepID=UPI002271DB47|nr:NAD(P)H-binding protein [Nannocystis sp. RBIL2]MCY1069099.1 NAD(P)H-binding protein [Nannocystis sp. RBIL2]